MPIPWSKKQRDDVDAAIAAHPLASGKCTPLARGLLPIARAVDDGAHHLVIRPRPGAGRFVALRAESPPRWAYHATTTVARHQVDALTGAEGTPSEEYLARYFLYPGALRMERSSLEEPWL